MEVVLHTHGVYSLILQANMTLLLHSSSINISHVCFVLNVYTHMETWIAKMHYLEFTLKSDETHSFFPYVYH